MFRRAIATLTSGLLVMAPFVILLHVLQKALGWVASTTAPLAARFGLDGSGSKLTVLHLEVQIMIGVCFLAGSLLRVRWLKRIVSHSEVLVIRIAQALNYVDKVKADALQKYDGRELRHWNTLLVSIEGAWLLAYKMERDQTGLITLYLPDPQTGDRGTIRCVRAGSVDLRPVPDEAGLAVLKAHGKGLSALLAAHPRR